MAVAGAAIALVTLVTGAYSAVQWIQFVMATLSVTGSSSIIAYAVFQNTVRSPEVRPLFYLSLSDLFLGVCWLAGALLYSMQTTNQDIICYNLQAAGQIFYMASFLYTINYTWHLYMDLKVKYSQTLHRMSSLVLDYGSCLGRTATILCSLIPFLLMVPVFCLGNGSDCYGNFSQKHGCLLMHTEINKPTGQLQPVGGSLCSVIYLYGIGIFLISFWVSFITILVLLIQARGLYKRYVNSSGFLGNQQWAVIKMVEQRVVFYPIAYFCCWGPAVLLGIMKLTVSENSRLYMALYILQLSLCILFRRTSLLAPPYTCIKHFLNAVSSNQSNDKGNYRVAITAYISKRVETNIAYVLHL
ncbi:transmembrane protein 116 isoform X2 [Alligator sinensis]|uniref:Transmembrane protein 116 isoform X2 n=1 Tax=Alligator sinensis TaxID=38654 RepID=A0A1U7RJ08_ALLSI|nr:transmembrane protein 116 isoform X2 [Alligator sinensis]